MALYVRRRSEGHQFMALEVERLSILWVLPAYGGNCNLPLRHNDAYAAARAATCPQSDPAAAKKKLRRMPSRACGIPSGSARYLATDVIALDWTTASIGSRWLHETLSPKQPSSPHARTKIRNQVGITSGRGRGRGARGYRGRLIYHISKMMGYH
jgi:hypothetical protein